MKYELIIEAGKIIVFTQIKGANELKYFKFILDTGSSKTVIDEQVVTTLGFDLKRLEKGDRLMTAGGSTNSKILMLPCFSLFGKDTVNFEVSVLNLPPQITYFVDGLVGMDFILQFKSMKFNFEEKTIEV